MPQISYIVRDEAMRRRVAALIEGLSLDKPWSIVIEPFKKKRSLSQNSLYWKWINDTVESVAKQTGHDNDDLHDFFKRKFLTPKIVEIEGETVARYSTKTLTVDQMREYMDRIYAWVTTDLGILLPLPEELGR